MTRPKVMPRLNSAGWLKLPAVIFVTFLAVTAATCWLAVIHNEQVINAALNAAATRTFNTIENRLRLYEYGLRGARGVIITAGEAGITRQKFEHYSKSRDLAKEFPGARGFGFIRRVPQDQESGFIALARRDDMPNFSVRQLAPHDGERYVIQYIEPAASNLPAIGLDVASEVNRRTAAVASMQSGNATLSGPITLVQATGQSSQAFLFFLPVYRTPLMPTDEIQRVQVTLGWTYAPLIMQEVLTAGGIDLSLAKLVLKDVSYPGNPLTFFENKQAATLPTPVDMVRPVFGRSWQLSLYPTPAFVAQLPVWNIAPIAVGGAVLSLLLALLAQTWHANRQRSRELAAAQLRLASIVESSNDGIMALDTDGNVMSWNRGAERIFGYTSAEAVGQKLAHLITPADTADEESFILSILNSGTALDNFDTRRRCKDGRHIAVSISASLMRDANESVIGISKIVRDITAQKDAEAAILESKSQLEEQVAFRTMELETSRKTLRTVLDSVPTMIGYWDQDLINRVANIAYHHWFGLDHESLPGKHMSAVMGPKLFARNLPRYQAALAGHQQKFEIEIKDRDANVRHLLTRYIPDKAGEEVKGFYVVSHDITEQVISRSKLAAALRENQLLLTTLNEQMLYSVANRDGIIIEVNDQFCAVHGFDRDELLGRDHRVLSSGRHSHEFWKTVWKTLQSGHAWRGEVCNKSRTGALYWFDTVIAPHLDDQGNVERYVALRVDITERKATSEQLAALNTLFSNLLNAATETGVISTDQDGIIRVFNTGAERMLGYKPADVIGIQTPELFHDGEEVAQRGVELSQLYGATISGFDAFVFCPRHFGVESRVWTYVRQDGVRLQVSLTVTAIRNEHNELVGYLSLATDVTEKLHQEAALAAAQDQLALAAEIAKLGIWTWTLHDNTLDWNDQMFHIYDQPTSLKGNGLSYDHWRSRVHPDDVVATEANLDAAIAGTATYDPIFRVLRSDGSQRYVQAGAYVERDTQGKVSRVIGINVDISERQEFEANLRAATAQAQEATLAKSQFLANMSHEIRTPMNAVLGMLQLLRQTSLDDRQADYADKAYLSGRTLLGLLNDILDFSKIDAGKMQIDAHQFELEDMMTGLAVVLSGNVASEAVELVFDLDPALPRVLIGDQLRLQQILINLAGNAVKFTHQGHVRVSVKLVRLEEGMAHLQIGVADTGIGISPDQSKSIFNGFTQAEASTTRRFGGTGLGLAISKSLVELMGGTLQLESTLGQGSHFWFDIALASPTTDSGGEMSESFNHVRKIMVVDDNTVSGEILCKAIASRGWNVDYADNGFRAIELVKQSLQDESAYEAIVMDMRMPQMDGVQTVLGIRQITGHPFIPVIMMKTGARSEEFTELTTGVDTPFNDFLTKPFTPLQLFRSIGQAIDGSGVPVIRSQAPTQGDHSLSGLRLLVVEDNAFNRQVAYELLLSKGASVALAESGLPGVSMVLEGEEQFDIVLMDLQMPDIDGLEATRRIRADRRFQKLPILAMTANASASDRAECLAAGMDEHVGKPIDIETLVPVLLALAGRIHDNASKLLCSPIEPTTPLIEPLETILKRLGGNRKIYSSVLTQFDIERDRLKQELTAISLSGTMREMAETLHGLKGMAATAGASALAKQASDMEAAVKARAQGPACEVMPLERVAQFVDLMHQSFELLSAAFADDDPVDQVMPPPSKLATEAWHREVDVLMAALSSGNMSAVDMMEDIFLGMPLQYRSLFKTAAEQVRNLEFDAAANTIQTALKVSG